MSIIAERSTHRIIESALTLPVDMKGRYEIAHPTTLGVLSIEDGSYVYPRDNGSVISAIERAFLSTYAGYQGVIYNPLLDMTDDVFDASAIFPGQAGSFESRMVKGDTPNVFGCSAHNEVGPSALDPTGYVAPGMMITTEYDIGALTGGLGALNFNVWWRAVTKTFTQDKSPIQGLNETANEPTDLTYTEADPTLLKVYISNDNGGSYSELTNLSPYSFQNPAQGIRLAFKNETQEIVYLLAYGIMY